MLDSFIIAKKVQGASHIALKKTCQDSLKVEPLDYITQYHSKTVYEEQLRKLYLDRDIKVAAIADGHGSEKCLYSEVGSRFAVEVFHKVCAEHIFSTSTNEELFQLFRKLDSTQITKRIHNYWIRRVTQSYNQRIQKEELIFRFDYIGIAFSIMKLINAQ